MASVVEKARRIGRRGLVVLSATAALAVSGVAFASWVITGEGDGAATAGTAADLENVSITVSASLYPGLTTDATLTVDNPNLFPVEITDVTFSGPVIITNAGAGCTDATADVTFTDVNGIEFLVPAEELGATEALTNAVTMGLTSNDDCQGATFTRAFELTASTPTS